MHFLRKYFKRFRVKIFVGQFFKLIEAILELYLPLVMADLIDSGVKKGDMNYVYSRGGLMILIAFVGLVTALVCQIVASRASQDFGTQLRSDLFAHINTLSHADVDRLGTPSLITRMTSDVNQLQLGLAMLIRLFVRAPFLAIGSIVMAISLDVKLSIAFLVVTPLITLVVYYVMKKSVPYFTRMQKQLDAIGLVTRENLEGARVVRAFSKQEKEKSVFAQKAKSYMDTALRTAQLSATLGPLTGIIMNFGIIAILLLGADRVNLGFLEQGVVIAFIQYMIQISLQIVIVANMVVLYTKAAASAVRVQEVFATEPDVKGASTAPTTAPDSTAIEFSDVSFAYHKGGGDALEHISFAIRRGETVGFIGGTGSGKSTLVNLIVRFYDVSSGKVSVMGADVRDYPLDLLRGKIGVVPQGATLVRASIRRNMCWGKADASDEEIWAALRTAQAAEFVEKLPGKLDYFIEEGGKNLSGGQRQRLTIARAIVRQPDILILDDSASALDFATDAALRRAINEDTRDMTVLLVSQRVSTIRYADQIVVLDDGGIAGIGTHEALMNDCQIYKEICLSQLSGEEAIS